MRPLQKKIATAPFLVLVLALALTLRFGAYASPAEWDREYLDLRGVGRCVIQTSDGGYAVAGSASGEFLLLKTDPNGDVQWSKTYGEGSANSVVQADDGGYVLAGNSTLCDLVKTDEQGNVQWNKTYYEPLGTVWANRVIRTSDGGFAVAGYSQNWTGSNVNAEGATFSLNMTGFIIKTDAEGNLLWNRTYGSSNFPNKPLSAMNDIMQTGDGGYAVATPQAIAKADSDGNIQWTRDVPGMSNFIAATPDGGYFTSGTEPVYLSNGSFGLTIATIIVKMDSQGNWKWRSTVVESNYGMIYSGAQTSDGGCVAAGVFAAEQHIETLANGTTRLSMPSAFTVGVVKVDANGHRIGNITYPPAAQGSNYIFSIIESSDGDYVFTGGRIGSDGLGHVWLVKTEIQPTPDTTPPVVTVLSPKNTTYPTDAVYLTFSVSEPASWMAYSLDGKEREAVNANTTLTGLLVGSHSIVVYANDTAGNAGASETVHFAVASAASPSTSPPPLSPSPRSIGILSPENQKVFTTPNVPLTFALNGDASWMGYSLDGQANMTVIANATVAGLADGTHSLVVYANDTDGNWLVSETVTFTVTTAQADSLQNVDYLPVASVVVIAAAAATMAGYLLSKRGKRSAGNPQGSNVTMEEELNG